MPDSRTWYLYILRCRDGSLYTGIALDPEERAKVHNTGQDADFTARRRPVELVYTETQPDHATACRREAQVKGWCAEKKEQLVVDFLRLRQC
jgi:predicted GIY-YIG superfamily endonuclease